MQTLFTFMHSMTSRVIRVLGGFWLVMYGADLSPVYAFMLAMVGTAIAVTGIADICPMELMFNATRMKPKGPQRRAA
jgi:hypothetical protein